MVYRDRLESRKGCNFTEYTLHAIGCFLIDISFRSSSRSTLENEKENSNEIIDIVKISKAGRSLVMKGQETLVDSLTSKWPHFSLQTTFLCCLPIAVQRAWECSLK